jgi:RNA-directed DNA polymerase
MMVMTLIEEITSDAVLEQAFEWLCKQREHHSPNADVWWVRYHWHEVKADIASKLNRGVTASHHCGGM